MGIKIWLDDNPEGKRPAPPGWIHVHNSAETWALLESNTETIDEMSFDNDLGEPIEGHHIIEAMTDRCLDERTLKYWPRKIKVHSANTVAGPSIEAHIVSFNSRVPDVESIRKWFGE